MLGLHAAVWQPVLGSALLGAGMGLIVSPLIVGLQNTVGWSERGVITSGAMFARFLGQSIGAAVFGAVTNSVLRADAHEQLACACMHRRMRSSSGLLVAGAITAAVLLVLVPRRFPSYQETDPM